MNDMRYNILIVDDDKDLCSLLKKLLEHEGLNADVCYNVIDALINITKNQYHLVVLDIMLPMLDGFETLKKTRELSSVPVLMLTSRTNTSDKIKGLEYGADDYLTKPFDIEEFMARVNSLIRRYTQFNNTINDNKTKLHFDGLIIDFESKSIFVEGQEVELNPKEFDILELLARNKGIVLSIRKIYENVWKEEFFRSDNTVTVHITKLREKIEADPKAPIYIKTIWGAGYKI